MKRSILALVAVIIVVCCLTLAACDKTNGQEILDSYIFEKADSIVTEDFVLPGKIGGQDASWSSDNGAIALSQRDGDWVAQINHPTEGEVSVKLTVTVAKASKSFTVRVKALDVYDFMNKYSFPKNKATIVDNFALDQEFSYKGKTATIKWTVDADYELYIKVSEDGKTLEVTPQSVQTSVQVKAHFTYNGETAAKSYRMTVYKTMKGLELVNYWYTNTGVSIDMSGYVVAIATEYSADYGNVSLYMVNDDLNAGYYLFRVKTSAANAAKLAPGVHIKATGTTNTNYNGLIETTAGGNLVVDDKAPIDLNNAVYAIDEEILGNLPSTVYNESRLVSLTNWKVTKVAEAKDKVAATNFTLLTLTKGKVNVDVRVSKYMEGAYKTNADDANWTALCNLTETATVGKTVNVTGILSKYKDTWQIMPLNAAAVTLSDKEADADDKTDYTGKKVATAIDAVNAFVTEQKLDGRIQETKDFEFPITNGDVNIAYEVVGSSNAVVIKDATMSVTPGNPETTTVLVTYTLGEFKTVQFLHITSLVPSAASMLEDMEVPKKVAEATNLPDAPAGTTVEWEVVNHNDSLVIKNGQFIPTLKEDSVPVIVRATLTYDGETRTKEYVVVVSAGKGAVAVEMPLVADKGYLLAVEQKTLYKTLYAVDEMSGDYLKTTDNPDDAANFFVEVVEAGGYRLYFKAEEAKNYISITVKANNKGKDTAYVCFEQDQAKAYVWNWNAEKNCFTTPVTIGETTEDYYIGTYKDFTTLSVSNLSYVSTSFPAFAAEIAFVPLTAYDIKVADTSSANAHVELKETKGINGEAFTFTVKVDERYELVSVTVNDEKVEGVDGVYTGYVKGETTVKVETKVEGAIEPTLVDTLKYTNSDLTTNMTGNNDAALVNLNAEKYTVISTESTSGSYHNQTGLNKAGELRMYAGTPGNVLTITSTATIAKIVITYTGTSYNGATILVDGKEVTANADGSYTINANSFQISNAKASGQVRIKTVEIYE